MFPRFQPDVQDAARLELFEELDRQTGHLVVAPKLVGGADIERQDIRLPGPRRAGLGVLGAVESPP